MHIIQSISRIARISWIALGLLLSVACIPLEGVAESPTIDFKPDPMLSARYITGTNLKTAITGSGTTIGPNHGLTAAHVCVPDQEWTPGEWIYQAYDPSGEWQLIVPVVIDFDHDVCIFYFQNPTKAWILVSEKSPERTEELYYIGYPRGIYHPNTSLKFRGYYAGTTDQGSLYTIPSTHGSSGSAIYNAENEIVSMVSMVVEGFQYITIGPDVQWIRRAIELQKENPESIVIVINGEVTGYSFRAKE